jgi:hypothetical protein
MSTRLVFALVLVSSLAVGCVYRDRYDHRHGRDHHHRYEHPGRGHGPPPHAPAHGYRHKYDGHDLRFDSRLGVYLVLDLADVFWWDGRYHRRHRDRWQHSRRLDGGWRDSRWDEIPPGLRGGGPGKGKGKGDKGKGRGKKGGY